MKLKHKLPLLFAASVLIPVILVLGITFVFSQQTRRISVDEVESLAKADLDHIIAGAISLAEANRKALALERETAVRNYLHALADRQWQMADRLYRQYPRPQAWAKIREELLTEKIGETGYAFGMNSEGVLTMHPTSEGKNLAGSEHIDRMRELKSGYIVYNSVTAKREKAVYYRYFEPLDLIIAPGVFIDEMEALYDLEAEEQIRRSFKDLLAGIRVGKSGYVWAASGAGDWLVAPVGGAVKPLEEAIVAAVAAGDGPIQERRYAVETSGGNRQPVMTRYAYNAPLDLVIGVNAFEEEMLAAVNAIGQSFNDMHLWVIVIAALVAVLSCLLALAIARRTAGPLQRGVAFAEEVAGGDLSATLEVESQDEIGDLTAALNGMVEGLSATVSRVRLSAAELSGIGGKLTGVVQTVLDAAQRQAAGIDNASSAVVEINASIKEVSQGVEMLQGATEENNSSILEMAASIEEVALNADALARSVQEVGSSLAQSVAAMGQIAESVGGLKEASETTVSSIAQMDASAKQVEENARNAADIAEGVRGDAESGRDSVQATMAGVGVIKKAIGSTAAAVSTLSGKAENIGNIVRIIEEVADQTNLLALNAAIIAAQAGENGRGFDVVAQEIKELAMRTGDSTREIANLIQSVQEEIGAAASSLTEANRSVDEGERLSMRSGEALGKIVTGIGQVSFQVQGIARATREQAVGSQAVTAAMELILSRVGQIATATREQEKGSDLIMVASERMRGLTDQVHATTREQSKTSRSLARNTEQMNSMVRQICRACDEQATSSSQIVLAMEEIQTSTRTNLQATQVMEEGAAGLASQIGLLQKEMETFKIQDRTA